MADEADAAQAAVTQAACSAFALGWNVAEMGAQLADEPPDDAGGRGSRSGTRPTGGRRRASGRRAPTPGGPASGPVVGELTADERWGQLVRRVRARLRALQDAVSEEAARECAQQAQALSKQPTREALRRFHVTVTSVLMAEDSRWGKAYKLGTTLRRLSTIPSSQATTSWYDAELVTGAKSYLADLQTILPAHAAMGVRGSLTLWEIHAPRQLTPVQGGALDEQARVWRALLSGETSATQDLDVEDYTFGVRRLLAQGKAFVSGLLRSAFGSVGAAVVSLVLLAVVIVGVLVAVYGVDILPGVAEPAAAATSDAEAVGGGIVALLGGAGGLGLLKKMSDGLGNVWDTVRSTVMDAALDVAVASAITQLPTSRRRGQLSRGIDRRLVRREVRRSVHPSGLSPPTRPSRLFSWWNRAP